jgi:hypothetical protein
VQNASLGGTVPLWEWIGDEPATTFSLTTRANGAGLRQPYYRIMRTSPARRLASRSLPYR